jgi:hypothetical protein
MPNFRKGGAAILSSNTPTNNNSTPRPQFVQWAQEEKKFVQFITPLEDIPRVKMHQFIITGQREDGSFIYNDFVSRRDSALDGPDGYDPIWTRFDLVPKDRCIAAAAVLNPVRTGDKITGWTVAQKSTKKGDVVPDIGLIVQHPGNFFSWLATFESDTGGSIENCVFSITRRGEKVNTRYDFIKTDVPSIDLSDYASAIPDIDEYLTALSDENRIRSLIDALPDDAKLSRFAEAKKPTASAEESAPWDDEQEPKNAKFSALRAKLENNE